MSPCLWHVNRSALAGYAGKSTDVKHVKRHTDTYDPPLNLGLGDSVATLLDPCTPPSSTARLCDMLGTCARCSEGGDSVTTACASSWNMVTPCWT